MSTPSPSHIPPLSFTYDGCMNTRSGNKMNLAKPWESKILIEDIAIGLSNNCHWTGQTSEPFTVAQHCVLVSWLAPDAFKLTALLHDGAEAYTGDVNKPFKMLLGEAFDKIEEPLNREIIKRFNLFDFKWVKDYDKAVQQMEHDHFFRGGSSLSNYLNEVNPKMPIVWGHGMAYEMFMQEYDRLTNPTHLQT